jgi:hypothetical protein
MTVEETNIVDFVATSPDSDDVLLVVSDHLDWHENEGEHLLTLQTKLHLYLTFIETGQLYTA